MTKQGCSDGDCRLRIGPTTGLRTNGGCRCLRDVPTQLRIEIRRKLDSHRDEIERLRDVLQRLFDYHDSAAPGCETEYLTAVADAVDILSDVRG